MALNARWIPKFSLNDIIRVAIGLAVVLFFLVHEAEWMEFRILQQLELWAYDAQGAPLPAQDAATPASSSSTSTRRASTRRGASRGRATSSR